MRSTADRIRHALLFEIVGIILILPLGIWLFDMRLEDMGVISVGSAIIATIWNYIFNVLFDRGMMRWAGTTRKSLRLRVLHAFLFEAGLVLILLPAMAIYLGITFYEALVLDAAIVLFYLVYAFLYNLAYDRIFPIPMQAAAQAS